MEMNQIRAALTGIVGQEGVFDNPEIEEIPPLSLDDVPAIRPRFRVKPADTAQVQELVLWANHYGIPLVPLSSGGPHFRGDTMPYAPESVIVDLSGMNKILKVDRRNRLAIIQPGVTHAQLLPELKKEGLRINMPLMPRRNKSVIASLLEREPVMSPKFQWSLMEPLRSLEIIWGSSEHFFSGTGFFRGEKESDWEQGIVPAQGVGAGPSQVDFYKFVSAAQGSMGIVTWASVKCEVLPKAQKIFFISSPRLENLIDFTYKLLKYRFGEELFLINNACLANLLATDPAQIQSLKNQLTPWTVVVNITGGDYFPQERVEGQEKDIRDIAQSFGLDMTPRMEGCMGYDLIDRLSHSCEDPYWKLRYKGSSEEIFFLTTLNKTPDFVETVNKVAEGQGYPTSDIGVYIQPAHQGVSCHCEFILPVNRQDPNEARMAAELFKTASEQLHRQGAFFSRPYGIWADMVFNADAQARSALRKVKNIFDPNNVMNPGKLCF